MQFFFINREFTTTLTFNRTMKNTIKQWAEEDRPREKMLQKGCSALTDTELLAIIIGSGTQNESAVDLAKKVMASANNNLNELGQFTINDLKKIKGIGQVKAITLQAMFELGKRRTVAEVRKNDSITSSKEIFLYMQPKIGDLRHEEFWVIYLNNSHAILGTKMISSGSVTNTLVDTKIIASYAISFMATGVILCHNHPSGNCRPSQEDKKITIKVIEAMKLLDCELIDHVIVSGNNYYSFTDDGL